MVTADDLAIFDGAVTLFHVPSRRDARGALHPFDFDALPFVPKRAFVVEPAAAGTARGGHAHRTARQILVRLAGTIEITLAYRGREATVRLDDTATGLVLAPGVWASHTYLTADARILVFASEPFDPGAYVTAKDRAGAG
ncbi:sugar 3,4-ketoisomerase [Rhodoplanes azumiensis]|uniref:Sugar 3,4-ketoisomerase n=1 Tax=Rhodoplanes azumiensis TaxID=1897628 RepID=A0ABW5ANS0_9BRAD